MFGAVTDEELEAWAKARSVELPAVERRVDLKLAIACGRGDDAALAEFDARYASHIASTARRFGDADFAREVGQLVRTRLFVAEKGARPRIDEYVGRGDLANFVRVVTARVALNQLDSNSRRAQVRGDEAFLELPTNADDPELAAMRARYGAEFKQAFADGMLTLDERLRSALRLHYLDGLTLADIGGLYGWSVPTASRRIAQAREELLTTTRGLMAQRMKLTPVELESVLRLIASRLSVDGLALA